MPRKVCCTVKSIIDHGGRVYTVELTPTHPVPSFRAGQFLHLTVDDYDPASYWPESRVLSIASSPRERDRLRICYSVKGRYTTKMEATLKLGGTVWVKLPYGDFVIDETRDAVLLAGGTGVSAFTAFIEALKPETTQQVWLVYGARNPDLLLDCDLYLRQLSRVRNFRVVFFTEQADDAFIEQMATLARGPQCYRGYISLAQLWSCVPELPQKVFYLSGPPVMLNALSAGLKTRGVPADQIRTDAWE